MSLSGYPVDYFEGDVSQFLCGICLDVYRDPHQCKNGHCFCKSCALKSIAIAQKCPTCNCKLDKDCLSRNLVARSIVQDLYVSRRQLKDIEEMTNGNKSSSAETIYPFTCTIRDSDNDLYFGQVGGGVDNAIHNGCGIKFEKKDDKTIYAGKFKNGLRHGCGVFFGEYTYAGEWEDGEMIGMCAVDFNDGNNFQGWYNRGEMIEGTFDTATEIYTGHFKDSLKHGKGHMIVKDVGTTYDCLWRGGAIAAGPGVVRMGHGSNVVVYDGELTHGGEPDGRGVQYMPNTAGTGSYYFGDWKDGKKEGKGTQLLPSGLYYVGDFEDNKFHGKGSVLYPNKTFYRGQFVSGLAHGFGVWRDCIGKSYEGEFVNGKFENLGTLRDAANNTSFVGTFLADRPHGAGEWKHADGHKRKITWDNGNVVTGCCCVKHCGVVETSVKCKSLK